MHRVDTANHVGNLFDDGDPLVPRPGTTVDAAIANAPVSELVNAIEGAGITLVKGTNTQLKAAMGMGATPAATARAFSGTHTIDTSAGTTKAAILKAATNSGGALKVTGTSTGSAAELETTGAQSEVLKLTPSADTVSDIAVNVAKGVVKFNSANPADAAGHTNKLSPLGLVKGWAHFAWSHGAPTLGSGMNMAAPGNPAAGQIQVNLTEAIGAGAVVVIGTAGPGQGYKVVPLDIAGKFKVEDQAGTAVDFTATTGFAFVLVMGRQ